ncbi:MAG: hypothetical protein SX243_14805 [Acidobacteriota bacterium]|nr:hypothetical protein [Acidobacteriota bacterium]
MESLQGVPLKRRPRSSRPAFLTPWPLVAGLVWLTVVGLGGAGFLHVHLGSEHSGDQVHGHFYLDRHHQHGDGEDSHAHPHPHPHPHPHSHSHSSDSSQAETGTSDLASGEADSSPADEAPSDEPPASDGSPAISLAPVASASPVPVTLPASSSVYQRLVLGGEQDFVAPDLLPSRNPRAPPRRSLSPTTS